MVSLQTDIAYARRDQCHRCREVPKEQRCFRDDCANLSSRSRVSIEVQVGLSLTALRLREGRGIKAKIRNRLLVELAVGLELLAAVARVANVADCCSPRQRRRPAEIKTRQCR